MRPAAALHDDVLIPVGPYSSTSTSHARMTPASPDSLVVTLVRSYHAICNGAMGFVNGLAIVIFLSQLGMFKKTVGNQKVWLQGQELFLMAGLVGLTMLIMFLLPKIKLTAKLPEALIGILLVFNS